MNILYEDEAIIVCEKEAGVATQTKQFGQKDMESLLKNYLAMKGERPYIGIVHRLDQPVSGVMVFAKTKEAAADLSRQVATKSADKYYYAVTDGIPADSTNPLSKSVVLEDYLLRDGKANLSKVVDKGTQGAKRAELSYQILEQKNNQAILRIKLETGRHHQIRVQLAHAGCPLVGDRKYNFKETIKNYRGNLALCSYKIAFKHPVTKKKMEFELPNPYQL